MAWEIERKFTVINDDYKKDVKGILYKQGYLGRLPGCTVRVRTADDKAFLTIKGPTVGASRPEFEYSIPYEDALSLFTLCQGGFIEKLRYKVPYNGMVWEVDEFLGANEGLVIAEIELESENQSFDLPSWVGDDVTGNPKYYNSNLLRKPFKEK